MLVISCRDGTATAEPRTLYAEADSELEDTANAVQVFHPANSAALLDVIQAAPAILDVLPTTALAALAGVSKGHCVQTSKQATSLTFSTQYAAPMLSSEPWPRLKKLRMVDITAGSVVAIQHQACCPDTAIRNSTSHLKQLTLAASLQQHCSSEQKFISSLSSRRTTNTAAVSSMVAAGLEQLQALRIIGSLHTSALQQIGSASYPALHTLQLSHVGMTAEGLRRLSQCWLPMLEVLDLTGNLLNRDAVPTLHGQHWPKLQTLTLADNRNLLDFFNFDAVFFSTCSWLNLESLDMSHCPLSFQRQVWPVRLPQLTSLTLAASWFGLGCDAMLIIVRAGMGKLTSLNLSHNKLDTEAVQILVTGEWPLLRHLLLHGVLGDRVSMQYLARGNWPKLETLQIQGNNLKEHALEGLFLGQWPALHTLEASMERWYKQITDRTGCMANPLHLWQTCADADAWSVQKSVNPLTVAEQRFVMNFWPWRKLHHVALHDYQEVSGCL